MKNRTKKTQITAMLTIMLIALSTPLFASTVNALSLPNWDVTGDWVIRVYYGGSTYDHDFTLQTSSNVNEFTGTGGYPAGLPYSITEVISGTVDEDSITWHSEYDQNDYYWDATGTIASDGTMSGTWTSSDSQSGTWESTDGTAQPAIITIEFPPDSTAVVEVTIVEEGNLPRCVPELPDGIGQYVMVEIVGGSFSGTATVCLRYDDSGMSLEEEQNLRLYMGDCVDFNLDGTINGVDLSLILQGIRRGQNVSPMGVPFDVNNDDEVDILDVNIVKEYMTKGLIVNLGLNDIEQARLPWIDITVSVDTEANIICGETGHFSIFRGR